MKSTKIDGRNEWMALAECHFERAKCEKRSIDIMQEYGIPIDGKTYLPDLEESISRINGCLEMVAQYSR